MTARGVDKATATRWLRVLAGRELDGLMRSHGFVRAANSDTFVRKVSQGRQRIHLDLYLRPSHSPDAVQLALRCSIAFPEMASIAAAMFRDEFPAFGKGGTVEHTPVDVIVTRPMMLFRTEEELAVLAPQLAQTLVEWVVPFLDLRDTVGKYVAAKWLAWEEHGTPGDVGHYPVLVAAGQMALGDPEAAAKTLEAGYPPGTRGRGLYRAAFDVVAAAQR